MDMKIRGPKSWMYEIGNINYHYYHELTDYLNELHKEGFEVIQIVEIKPSGDPEKMHRADVLLKKRKKENFKKAT